VFGARQILAGERIAVQPPQHRVHPVRRSAGVSVDPMYSVALADDGRMRMMEKIDDVISPRVGRSTGCASKVARPQLKCRRRTFETT
jgi:hypothetical protein